MGRKINQGCVTTKDGKLVCRYEEEDTSTGALIDFGEIEVIPDASGARRVNKIHGSSKKMLDEVKNLARRHGTM